MAGRLPLGNVGAMGDAAPVEMKRAEYGLFGPHGAGCDFVLPRVAISRAYRTTR